MAMPLTLIQHGEAGYCRYPHFKGEETEAQRGKGPAQGHRGSWAVNPGLSPTTSCCIDPFLSLFSTFHFY